VCDAVLVIEAREPPTAAIVSVVASSNILDERATPLWSSTQPRLHSDRPTQILYGRPKSWLCALSGFNLALRGRRRRGEPRRRRRAYC
jgi:hypothetical protein